LHGLILRRRERRQPPCRAVPWGRRRPWTARRSCNFPPSCRPWGRAGRARHGPGVAEQAPSTGAG